MDDQQKGLGENFDCFLLSRAMDYQRMAFLFQIYFLNKNIRQENNHRKKAPFTIRVPISFRFFL
jgi:deoxyadenosine/deoxycytidine kinase